MLNQQVKDGGIIGKQWPKFDSDPGKHEHYEICVVDKLPDGTFITCWIYFEWDPLNTAMKKCVIVIYGNYPFSVTMELG